MTDITIANGPVKLAASVYGSPAAEPILFLHGVSHSRDTWEEIAQRLSSKYCVWTLDFRGHGHSDRASYELADFVADAEAALAAIGQPAVVVGHSLGACVAGIVAQAPHPQVRAVFLEDPPWFLGEASEWQRSPFPKLFPVISAAQATLQQQSAPLAAYLTFIANAPSPMGGTNSDHFSPRHLLSHASALQRRDTAAGAASSVKPLAEFSPPSRRIGRSAVRSGSFRPIRNAALRSWMATTVRLARINPQAEIVHYPACGHTPHRARAFEQRFSQDLEVFVAALGEA